MSEESLRDNSDPTRQILRPSDQRWAAALTFAGLVLLGTHWLYEGAHRGRLIEFESPAPPLPAWTVDLNRAEGPELTLLPGIGEALAHRIIASREESGPYRRVEDLRRVRGIGPRTVERLRPFVYVDATDQ